MDQPVFTFVGYTLKDEAVYVNKDGDVCIEKDHDYLVEATTEENAEIRSRMSFLFPADPEKAKVKPWPIT